MKQPNPGGSIDSPNYKLVRPSLMALGVRLGVLIFIIESAYALIFIFYLLIEDTPLGDSYFWVLWLAHTIKFFFLIGAVIREVAKWLATRYVISGHHLTIDTELGREYQKIYELKQLDSLEVKQGWLAKQLGYADVVLNLQFSGHNEILVLPGIVRYQEVTSYLEKYLDVEK